MRHSLRCFIFDTKLKLSSNGPNGISGIPTFFATIISPFNNGIVIDFLDVAQDDELLAISWSYNPGEEFGAMLKYRTKIEILKTTMINKEAKKERAK